MTWSTLYVRLAPTLSLHNCTMLVPGVTTFTTLDATTIPAPSPGQDIMFVAPTGGLYGSLVTDVLVPADYLELAGLNPSSCHATAGGIPFGNIPVLSLTATSTILQGVFQSLSTKGSTFPVTTETHLTSSMMPLTLSKSSSKEISSSKARYTSGPPAPGTKAATTAGTKAAMTADPLQFPTQ